MHIKTIGDHKFEWGGSKVCLVINDRNGETTLTKKDVERLKKLADENNDFSFFYIGTEKLGLFTESGIFKNVSAQEDDMSFGYVYSDSTRMTYSGAWSKTDEEHYANNNLLFFETIADIINQTL